MQTPAEPRPRRLLAVAYIFPPFFSVGGSIRVVKFLKYLPGHHWKPFVLTVDDSREYKSMRRGGSEELFKDLPPEVEIVRTGGSGEPSAEVLERARAARERGGLLKLAMNTLKRIRDWAERWMLIPDEYILWLPAAFKTGRKAAKEKGIDLIFATCPPHSASVIAMLLKWFVRKPLVLDFRDDWVDTVWYCARPPLVRMVHRLLERLVVRSADRVILVTPLSRELFVKRYPRQPATKFVYIPNGVDLADYPFGDEAKAAPSPDGPFTIVHAGLLTVAEDWPRSPEVVFQALAHLRQTQPEIGCNIRLLFTGELPDVYRERAKELGLGDTVKEVGYLPRQEFADMLQQADLLLAINYHGFPTLIPGKIYEYWAAGGPPILLLSSPGAAEQLLNTYHLGTTLDTDDTPGIEKALLDFYQRRQAGQPVRITRAGITDFAREALADRLARLLDETAGSASPAAKGG